MLRLYFKINVCICLDPDHCLKNIQLNDRVCQFHKGTFYGVGDGAGEIAGIPLAMAFVKKKVECGGGRFVGDLSHDFSELEFGSSSVLVADKEENTRLMQDSHAQITHILSL